MVASNHLYPIINKTTQNSISQINSNSTGKPYVQIKKEPLIVTKQIHIMYEIESIMDYLNDPNHQQYHLICTQPGWVNQLFEYFVVNGDIYITVV